MACQSVTMADAADMHAAAGTRNGGRATKALILSSLNNDSHPTYSAFIH